MSFKDYQSWAEERKKRPGNDKYTQWVFRTHGKELLDAFTKRANDWINKSNSFLSDNYNRYSGRKGTYEDSYVSDSADWLASTTERRSELDREKSELQRYLNYYSPYLDSGYSSELNKAFRNASTQYDNVVKTAQSDVDYWGQWENEEKYNDYLSWKKTNDEYLKYDSVAGQSELDRLNTEISEHWNSIQPGIAQTEKYIEELEAENKKLAIYVAAGHKESIAKVQKNKEKIANARATINDAIAENDSLKLTLSEKTEYHATATKAQNDHRIMTEAQNILNSADLERYAGMGVNSPDNVVSSAKGYDKTFGDMALDALKVTANGVGLGDFDETGKLFDKYSHKEIYDLINKHATDKEKAVYNAYLGMGDTAKAEEYMTYLLDTYRQKEAGEYTTKYDQTALELAFSLGAGFDSGMMGLVNAGLGLAGKDPIQYTSTNQYATGTMRENNGFVWGIANDLAMNIGNQIPSMAVGALNPTAGAIALGLSAGGNKYAETIARGYGKEEALGVAASVGTLEAVLGRMLGGISKYGGISQWTDDIIQGISKAGWRLAADLGIKFTGETIEEGLQAVLEPYLNNAFLGTNEKVNWEEVGYSALLGGLSAGVLEGVPMGVNTAIDAISNRVDTINKYSAQPAELVAKVLEIDPENQVALKAQEKIGAGEKVSKGDILSMAKMVESQPATTKAPTATPVQTVEEKSTPAMKENPVVVVAKDSKGNTVKGEIRGIQINGGKVSYNLSDGSTVRADKVSFATENEALVAKIAAERVGRVEGFTTEAALAMIKGYDGSVSVSEYASTFNEAFSLGAQGADISGAVSLGKSKGIDSGTVYAAYVLGQKNSPAVLKSGGDNAIINTESEGFLNESKNAEGVYLRDGGKRPGGADPEGQVSSVEGGPGKTATWREGSRVADREAARLANEGREVTVADLGILGGSKTRKVRLVDSKNETASMKQAREHLEAQGLNVRFFVGDNLLIEESDGKGGTRYADVRGYILGNQVLVRADHPLYTADQIARHEAGHAKIRRGEIDIDEVRARLEKTVGKENVDEVARHYADAYEGSGLSPEEIWEECICDSLGDMNIFAMDPDVNPFMSSMMSEVKAAATSTANEGSQNQTRGSPTSTEGKASREFNTDDLYTSTDEFYNQVVSDDRHSFARSLANKTLGMRDGEIRTVYIYCATKVYAFKAYGYMHGEMIETCTPDEYNDKIKSRKEYKNELDTDRKTADLWSKPISDFRRGSGSDISVFERRGRPASDDTLSEDSLGRYTSRYTERERQNFATKEEVKRIVGELKKLYGFDTDENGTAGKASRELDFIDYINEQAGEEELARAHSRADESMMNRLHLINALESITEYPSERGILNDYRAMAETIAGSEKRIADIDADIKALSKNAEANAQVIKMLKAEKNTLENQIHKADERLLNLESTKALKGVLERERSKAYESAKNEGQEALAKQKAKSDAKLEALKEYYRGKLDERRIKANERLDETVKKYRESRAKGIEGRHKTAERHAIRVIAKELDKLLNRGTKERNVKKGEQTLVRRLLDITDMLFATDEELILNGIVTDTTSAEKAAINQYIALYDEYHSFDDSVTENKEHRRELRSQMNEVKKGFEGVLERERQRINDATASDTFDALIKEYERLTEADERYIREAFDNDTLDHLKFLKQSVGNTLIKDMSLEQLKTLHKALTMVKQTVQNSNKLFGEKNATVEQMGAEAQAEIEKHGHKKTFNKTEKAYATLSWNNLKPIYLLERTGSKVMQKLGQSIFKSESQWAVDMSEAKAFSLETMRKHGYKNWNFDKTYSFKNATGQTYDITLGQIMSVYAYSKRGEQALEHLRTDGFVFDATREIKDKLGRKYELNDKTAYKITDENLVEMINKLTSDQKAYVDDMQKYLSETMGAKGNEVSMQLYGIDLFGEENYFPIHSEGAYLERVRQQAQGETKIKNKGFTKPTQKGARNPVVLSEFNKVWSEHVSEMSAYHAFTLPLEDFYKVFNYQTSSSTETNKRGVIPALENAYGEVAVKAIEQLLSDLNGDVRSNPREGFAKKALTAFKKAKTLLSLSVIVQQPSAILRAQAMIDAKYFAGKKISKTESRQTWEEIKKYAPVAIIKDMGHFDVGMGRSSADWLLDEGDWKDKLDDILSKPASKADELAWCGIWNAVKRETARNNPSMNTSSEEFLQKAGERFEDVIRHTQVYDSTLAKSSYMRDKNVYMQMVMAFMAEPTTSINMREMALRSGDKKRILKTTAAVYASTLLNALLVAIPYSMRDDDEDETAIEKYVTALSSSFIDNINPITSLPFIKDVWSLAQGYDIERSDMSLPDDFLTSAKKLANALSEETIDQKKVINAVLELFGDLSSFTGIPVDNVIRDAKSVINAVKTITRDINGMDTTWNSIADALEETLRDETPVVGWIPGENKNKKLYDAIMAGDEAYVDRFRDSYSDYDSYKTALRKALRENDPRIKAAAEALSRGDDEAYEGILDEIVDEWHFDEAIIEGAIEAEVNSDYNDLRDDTRIKEAAMAYLSGDDKKRYELEKSVFDEGEYKYDLIQKARKAEVDYVHTRLVEAKGYVKKGRPEEAEAIYRSLIKKGYSQEFIEAYMKKIK